jgi:hypothetical protein
MNYLAKFIVIFFITFSASLHSEEFPDYIAFDFSNRSVSLESLDTVLKQFGKRIQKLTCANSSITNEHLKSISKECSILRHLSLSKCKRITDKGLEFLTNLPTLESLNLSYFNKITPREIKYLTNLINLESLDLSHCASINGEALELLGTLSNLKFLNLSGCSMITDEDLLWLTGFYNLVYLNLTKCSRVTPEGIARLKGALPGCLIAFTKS